MNIRMIGTDYRVASLALRERLALPEASLGDALRTLEAQPELAEVAVLSTCNRTEIYFVPSAAAGPITQDSDAAGAAVVSYLASVVVLMPMSWRRC